MAKRKSLNRRSSKFGRSSSRSSIGSNILDPDSNLLDEEQPFWWNVSLLKSSTHIPIVSEPSTILNPDSQLNSTEEHEWWKHLQTSRSSPPNIAKGITKSTGDRTVIEETSSSASEESIPKVQKRKVLLRKTTRKSSGANVFLDVLNDSDDSAQSGSVPLKRSRHDVKNSLRSEEKVDEESDLSNDTHVDNSYQRILKKKPKFLTRKRKSKSINPFEEILSQQDTSLRSSPGRSLKHTTTEKSVNQENLINTSSTNLKSVDGLKGDAQSNKSLKNVSTASTNVESADESEDVGEFVKPKSRFLTRTRKRSSRHVFENILVDESNDSNEKLDTENQNSSTHKDDSASEPLTKSASENGKPKNASNSRSNSRQSDKDEKILKRPSTNKTKNVSRNSSHDILAGKESTDAQQNVDHQRLDSRAKNNSTKKNSVNKSLSESLTKNYSGNVSIDKTDRNRISRSEDRLVVSGSKENEANLTKSITENLVENEIANERSMSDSVNEEKRSSRSERNKTVNKSLNKNSKSLSVSDKRHTVDKRTLHGSQAEESNSRTNKEISEQPKNVDIGTSEKKDNSADFQLQVSTSSESDGIQQHSINQSLAQKTLESDITLSTFKNLNAAASSTPIEVNRKSKRLSNLVQDSSKKKTAVKSLNNEPNVLSLAGIDEEEDEIDVVGVAETPQDVIKRKNNLRVSENRSKRRKTLEDDENEEVEYADDIVNEETIHSTKNVRSKKTPSAAKTSIGRNRSRLRTPDNREKDDVEENSSSLTNRSLNRRSQSQMVLDAQEDRAEENISLPAHRRKSRLQDGIDEDLSPIHKSINRRTRSQMVLDDEEGLEESPSSPTLGRKTKSRMTLEEEDERVERNTSLPINTSPSRRTRSQHVLDEENQTMHEENAVSPKNTSIEKNKSRLKATPEKRKQNDADKSPSSPAHKLSSRRTRSGMTLDEGENISKDVSSVVVSNAAQNSTHHSVADKENHHKNIDVPTNVESHTRKIGSTRTIIENDEDAEEDEEEVGHNLSGPQERRLSRNKSIPAVSGMNKKDTKVPDKPRTDSRFSHTTLQRSKFFRKDMSMNNPATNMSRGQRTLGDFFKGRSPTKSVLQHSTAGPPSSDAFADKQKVEEVRKKLEELKKRKLTELEANLNRQKKQAVHDIIKPKIATKKPTRVKTVTEVDKAYIVNGQVYKRPKLPRPKRWVTDRLYKFLWKCMEPKYGLATRVRSEKFVLGLSEVVSLVCRRKKYENYQIELDALIMEMARLGIIKTRQDFYHFCQDYLPAEFRDKAVPMMLPGNVRNIPFDPSTVLEPLIPQEE